MPALAPWTRTVPFAVKVPSAFCEREFSLVIWNSAPVRDRLPASRSILLPISKASFCSGGNGCDVPVVVTSCSSDGLNDVL